MKEFLMAEDPYHRYSNEAERTNQDNLWWLHINSFKSAFTIVILIHYKPRVAAAILDL